MLRHFQEWLKRPSSHAIAPQSKFTLPTLSDRLCYNADMTDGPHKSLPQKRPWKVVAEKTASKSYSCEDSADAMDFAIRCELASVPFDAIHRIVGGRGEPSLFQTDIPHKIAQLEMSRELCRGSAIASRYIDCHIAAALDGIQGQEAIRQAVIGCISDTFRSSELSTIEHYKRKNAHSGAANLLERWHQASRLCDVRSIAYEIVTTNRVQSRKSSSLRQTSLDAGPETHS